MTCVRASLGPLFRLCLGGLQLVLVCCVGVGAPKACPNTVAEGRACCLFAAAGTVCTLVSSWCWPGVAGPSRKGIAREHKAQMYVRGRVHGRTLSRSLSMCVSYLSLCVLTHKK